MSNFTLLYDGQCVICRFLVERFVKPTTNESFGARPFQEVLNEGIYPEEELKRCTAEILLVDEANKQFLGGISAVAKTLELTHQLPIVRMWLSIQPLKPLNWFVYRMVAWHRYSWFIVPPYLRCAECELQIPTAWNILFFTILGLTAFGASLFNVHLWFQSLQDATPYLFSTIKPTLWSLSALSVLLASLIFVLFNMVAYFSYNKVLGVNRLEVVKQNYLAATIFSLITATVLPLAQLAGIQLHSYFGGKEVSWVLAMVTGFLSGSLAMGQMFVFFRWREIGFCNWKSILSQLIDFLLRLSVVGFVLYFA